jgi:hypothetical protein
LTRWEEKEFAAKFKVVPRFSATVDFGIGMWNDDFNT